jgi:hypothetical protein
MPKQGERAEKEAQRVLSKEFGVKLESRKKVMVGNNLHEFDLVSEKEGIFIEVKDYKFDNPSTGKAGYSSTRKHRLIGACFYLEKVKKAKKRILVLTDKRLCEQFKKDMQGLLSKVEIRHIPVK